MITIDDLKTAGIAEDKATQIITDLGDAVKKFTPENVGKKAFDEVDMSVLMLTKIQKDNNEKTTDYVKRALNEYSISQSEEKSKELTAKISDLEEKLKNHKGDETLKAEIHALKEEKAKLPDLKNQWVKEWKDKFDETNTKLEKLEKISVLKSVLPDKIKSDLSKDYVDFKINNALENALKNFDKFETSTDGTLFLIDSVNVDKVVAKEFFKENLKDIIDAGTNATGGGASGGNGANKSNTLQFEPDASPGQKVTKIREFLATQKGIDSMNPKFEEEFNTLLKENGLKDLMTIKEEKK